LVELLGEQELRVEARAALVEHGEEALRLLDEALGDGALPLRIRRQVPRTISRFPPRQATPILVKRLLPERDGMTRFRILRGLGRIQTDHPDIPLDTGVLREALELTVDSALQLLRWRTSLIRSAAEDPRRATPGHELLITLLRDKETHTVERAFRLVALIVGGEDLRSIHRGLKNTNRKVRASSRELLEHVLPGPVRGRLLALVDDASDDAPTLRFEHALDLRVPYLELLESFADSGSESLRALAQYHADELAHAG
jgi:HEAT repeat protein